MSIFCTKWISNNLERAESPDIISEAKLVQKLFAVTKAVGISSNELEKQAAVSQAVLEAIIYRAGGHGE